jgi:phytoene dehydrogenase-like protein
MNSVSYVLDKAGADVELVPNPGGEVTYYDWRSGTFGNFAAVGFADCNPEEKQELICMFNSIASMTVEEINRRYEGMSLLEWAERNLSHPDLINKIFILAFEEHSKMAANVFLRYYHNIRTSKIGMSYPRGGIQEIPNSLVRAMTKHGGHVVTDATCKEIIMKDGAVNGVEFQVAPQNASYSHSVEVETDLVVSAIPGENVFNVLAKETLPSDFVARVEKIGRIPEQQTAGVVAAVKAETYKPNSFLVGVKPKEKGREPRIVFAPSVACPEVARDGYHLLYYDTTATGHDVVANSESIYEEMLEELRDMYRSIKFEWVHLYVSGSRVPSYSTDVIDSRGPDVRADGVKGLYFTGVQFRGMGDTGGIGIERALSSARRCVDAVLAGRASRAI